MIISVAKAQFTWFSDFEPEQIFLVVHKTSAGTVQSSIELPLTAWNLLESQRLRFWKEVLIGVELHPRASAEIVESKETYQNVTG